MQCKFCDRNVDDLVYIVLPPLDNIKLCWWCWQHFEDEFFTKHINPTTDKE